MPFLTPDSSKIEYFRPFLQLPVPLSQSMPPLAPKEEMKEENEGAIVVDM